MLIMVHIVFAKLFLVFMLNTAYFYSLHVYTIYIIIIQPKYMCFGKPDELNICLFISYMAYCQHFIITFPWKTHDIEVLHFLPLCLGTTVCWLNMHFSSKKFRECSLQLGSFVYHILVSYQFKRTVIVRNCFEFLTINVWYIDYRDTKTDTIIYL